METKLVLEVRNPLFKLVAPQAVLVSDGGGGFMEEAVTGYSWTVDGVSGSAREFEARFLEQGSYSWSLGLSWSGGSSSRSGNLPVAQKIFGEAMCLTPDGKVLATRNVGETSYFKDDDATDPNWAADFDRTVVFIPQKTEIVRCGSFQGGSDTVIGEILYEDSDTFGPLQTGHMSQSLYMTPQGRLYFWGQLWPRWRAPGGGSPQFNAPYQGWSWQVEGLPPGQVADPWDGKGLIGLQHSFDTAPTAAGGLVSVAVTSDDDIIGLFFTASYLAGMVEISLLDEVEGFCIVEDLSGVLNVWGPTRRWQSFDAGQTWGEVV